MCRHNKRLDESLCWACCSGRSSEIDWNVMIVIMNELPMRHESDKDIFEKNWWGPKNMTFEQFIEGITKWVLE